MRFLAMTSPSGLETFWAELSVTVTDTTNPPQPLGPPHMGRVLAICAKHGIEFVERPGGRA